MVNWNFWTGFDYNDTWSIAYHFKERFQVDLVWSYVVLGIILLVCGVLIWRLRKRKN